MPRPETGNLGLRRVASARVPAAACGRSGGLAGSLVCGRPCGARFAKVLKLRVVAARGPLAQALARDEVMGCGAHGSSGQIRLHQRVGEVTPGNLALSRAL